MIVLILRCHVTRCVGFCVSLMDNVWSFCSILAPLVFRLCTFDAELKIWPSHSGTLPCLAARLSLDVGWLSLLYTLRLTSEAKLLRCHIAQGNLTPAGLSPLSLICLGLQYTPTSQLYSPTWSQSETSVTVLRFQNSSWKSLALVFLTAKRLLFPVDILWHGQAVEVDVSPIDGPLI